MRSLRPTPTGTVTYINPVAQKLTGWEDHAEAREAARRGDAARSTNRSRAPLDRSVQIVRAAGNVVGLSNNVLLLSRSGPEYPIEMNGAPIMNDHGELIGVVAGVPRHYPAPSDRADAARQRSPDAGGTPGRDHRSRNPQPTGHRFQPAVPAAARYLPESRNQGSISTWPARRLGASPRSPGSC